MMDFILITECLSSVAAIALTLFVIIVQQNISSENWFVSKKKIMWVTSPFAVISFSLGAYFTHLVNMEMNSSTTPSAAPIQIHPNMKFNAVLAARFTLLCAYTTCLMGLVTLKTGWNCALRNKIPLCLPFFTSLVAIDLCFLQVLWEWICNAQPGPHFLTDWVYYCMFASWFFASFDMGIELRFHQLIKLGKEAEILHVELDKIEIKIVNEELGANQAKMNIEDAKKHLTLLQLALSKI